MNPKADCDLFGRELRNSAEKIVYPIMRPV
jgi:hypothetical protein